MCQGIHLLVGLRDAAVGPDQVADPRRVAGVGRVAGSVGEPDGAIRVAEQRVRERELLGEGPVLLDAVEADPEDLGVLRLELLDVVAEPATLDGSARGVGFRVEPEQDVVSRLIGELHRLPPMILDLEVGGCVSFFQHLTSSSASALISRRQSQRSPCFATASVKGRAPIP
jgi:hypothetical protein